MKEILGFILGAVETEGPCYPWLASLRMRDLRGRKMEAAVALRLRLESHTWSFLCIKLALFSVRKGYAMT